MKHNRWPVLHVRTDAELRNFVAWALSNKCDYLQVPRDLTTTYELVKNRMRPDGIDIYLAGKLTGGFFDLQHPGGISHNGLEQVNSLRHLKMYIANMS